MKLITLAAAGAALFATAAQADTVTVTKERGNYSAPVAGATPQARDYPASDTTVLRDREKKTVRPSTTVVVPAEPAPTVVERRVQTRVRVAD